MNVMCSGKVTTTYQSFEVMNLCKFADSVLADEGSWNTKRCSLPKDIGPCRFVKF